MKSLLFPGSEAKVDSILMVPYPHMAAVRDSAVGRASCHTKCLDGFNISFGSEKEWVFLTWKKIYLHLHLTKRL